MKAQAKKLHLLVNVNANLGSIESRHQSEVQQGQPQPPPTKLLKHIKDDVDGVVQEALEGTIPKNNNKWTRGQD